VTIPNGRHALIPVELGEQKWRGNTMICRCGRSIQFTFDHLARTIERCECGHSKLVPRRVLPEEERPKTPKRMVRLGVWKKGRQKYCRAHGTLTEKDLVSNGAGERCKRCFNAASKRQWRKRQEQVSA
jgi:hypothetical protein